MLCLLQCCLRDLPLSSHLLSPGLTSVLQLFMLFLVHAYGSRVWRPLSQFPCSSQSRSHSDHTELDHLWYLDGPWRLFWPVVVPWCCLEAAVSFTWLHANKGKCNQLYSLWMPPQGLNTAQTGPFSIACVELIDLKFALLSCAFLFTCVLGIG